MVWLIFLKTHRDGDGVGDGAAERGRADRGVPAGDDVGDDAVVADAVGEPDVHRLADQPTEGGTDLEVDKRH